ncbi:hypothetical protein OSB04_012499 [Centaurea solstitialis]|uniref:Uncharacterized protein n=1 Tax=Centaurea solstitialis TaxID=347529 RepID=A0AA38WMH5_9ASTR|nr:hypothetical protein OSB04_012499 [Centaurea solstitialis]
MARSRNRYGRGFSGGRRFSGDGGCPATAAGKENKIGFLWKKNRTIRIGYWQGLRFGLLPIGSIGNTPEDDHQGCFLVWCCQRQHYPTPPHLSNGYFFNFFTSESGAINDIVVINQSPIFNDLFEDKAPIVANDVKRIKFKERQESVRKDIEGAFEVLQEKWHIITRPARIASFSSIVYEMSDQTLRSMSNPEVEKVPINEVLDPILEA